MTAVPDDFQLPTAVAEWTLDEAFDQDAKPVDWREGLFRLLAFTLNGVDLYLMTADRVIRFPQGRSPVKSYLPEEVRSQGLQPISRGVGADILFRSSPANKISLYLFSSGTDTFTRIQPQICPAKAPTHETLRYGLGSYGWSDSSWHETHWDRDEGRRVSFAYTIVPWLSLVIPSNHWWVALKRRVGARLLHTNDGGSQPLKFDFTAEAAFRVEQEQRLVIRAGNENPIDGRGVSGKHGSIYLEIFPSRLCRIYHWTHQSGRRER